MIRSSGTYSSDEQKNVYSREKIIRHRAIFAIAVYPNKERIPKMSGDWSKLTDYLKKDTNATTTISPTIKITTIILTDADMLNITGSQDKSKTLYIDFTDERYSIQKRAEDAGYAVIYHPKDKSIKIFIKNS